MEWKQPMKQPKVRVSPELVNFGNVKAGTKVVLSVVLTNTGKYPMHYSVSQPDNGVMKILTIPGMLYPGLKVTLKIVLDPAEPQYISASVTLKAKETLGEVCERNIPITANIVE